MNDLIDFQAHRITALQQKIKEQQEQILKLKNEIRTKRNNTSNKSSI